MAPVTVCRDNLPMRASVLCGLGWWLPPDIVTNDQLACELDTSDEWIRNRTGIVRRHIASPGMATSELAVEAGQRALKSAGLEAVDALILATTTPDFPCPATAPEVANRLGLGTIAAFDIAAVCTGFIYALANAAVLRAGSADDIGAIGPFTLGSDGRGANLITVPGGGSRRPYRRDGHDESEWYFTMQGQRVYRRAVQMMTQSSERVLELAGWPVSAVDWLVCHQANRRILDAVAARLRIPADRCVINIDQVGNTAAASIPLALAHGAESGAFRPGDRIVLTGFGGGLTWGSTLLRWPEIVCGN